MSEIKEILNLILSHQLTDILLVGYIDNDDKIKRFIPIQEDLYMEFENTLLRCSSVFQYDKLKMTIIDEIQFDYPFDIEEGDEFCTCSVFQMYFAPYGTYTIEEIEILLDEECSLDEGLVKCAAFSIEKTDYLFLDPTHIFGIQINARRSLEEWFKKSAYIKSNYRKFIWNRSNLKTEITEIDLTD